MASSPSASRPSLPIASCSIPMSAWQLRLTCCTKKPLPSMGKTNASSDSLKASISGPSNTSASASACAAASSASARAAAVAVS